MRTTLYICDSCGKEEHHYEKMNRKWFMLGNFSMLDEGNEPVFCSRSCLLNHINKEGGETEGAIL